MKGTKKLNYEGNINPLILTYFVYSSIALIATNNNGSTSITAICCGIIK